MFENLPKPRSERTNFDTGPSLAENFSALLDRSEEGSEIMAFERLEMMLLEHGFTIASSVEVGEILASEKLLCRSEQFSKVIDLIENKQAISVVNAEGLANMCTVSAGSGFRTAMLEGFSGKDVRGVVKVVLTFSGEHLSHQLGVPKDNDVWQTKPDTAAVSLVGRGDIEHDDVRMVSFRFPVKYFPETYLSEEEKDRLEEERTGFVVRHYVPYKNAAPGFVS